MSVPNLSTILVGLVVFGTFGAIIFREFRRHKAGKGGCSCGCDQCPGHDLCHGGTAHSQTPGAAARPKGE